MPNLIIISGPQAVGKMTVAEKLRDKIGYRLMTNHDSLELSDIIFEKKSDAQKEFSELIRKVAFETAIKYNVNMIFTYALTYNDNETIEYVQNLKNMFEKSGGKFYFVELFTDLETRLKRNLTPHRLEMKPSKRDTVWSENDILESIKKYRFNSYENEFICENHLKIDNTNLQPNVVADMIIKEFLLGIV